ncbi:hypothetical protein SBF1_950040 [Candidatus Desulfosporosinus infrequens]|uniref:Uncharacterized protein n=1 Tax=Candidatus Desulfosporosinus infrequens TaxID=2043169 RepID=A0A2U3LYB8_9FIRM|nr:hypothetical protein SBF1_950040 [Candidatus Desulfosporosinus infrequens]
MIPPGVNMPPTSMRQSLHTYNLKKQLRVIICPKLFSLLQGIFKLSFDVLNFSVFQRLF